MSDAAIAGTGSFPITWERPEDARVSWWFERWHLPRPASPLTFDYGTLIYGGMNRGRRVKRVPGHIRSLRVNTYVYMGVGPGENPQPIGSEEQPDRFDNHATWDALWLPEIREYLRRWREFDRAAATDEDFLRYLGESAHWFERCWEIHSRIEFSASPLFDLVAQVLGWTAEEARDLVAGVESKSIEGDDALRALARLAASQPHVRQAILDRPAGEVLEALRHSQEARDFVERFNAYLDEFGRRSDNFSEISLPTWIEDPAPVFALLKAYVRQPDYDSGRQRAAIAGKRAAAQERARAEFAERAPERLGEFERELAFGLRANALNEDHNYWLDQQTWYWMRMDMLEAGRRLATAGVIADRDDVFMLTRAEVLESLASPRSDLRAAIEERRTEIERWGTVEPIGQIGAPMPPDVQAMVSTMFGQMQVTSTEAQVRGLGASGGTITGRARLIRSLDEADRLGPGEILVTKTTSPPWTALFGLAAAIVTDAGGPLSHAAIVAREYGIPAVVGTMTATKQIADGQMIRVDGSAGTVDLIGGA